MHDSHSHIWAYGCMLMYAYSSDCLPLNDMQMCRTVSVCGRMAVHLPERQHIGTAHKCWFVCKLSWKNMKEWITQTPLQVEQDRSAKEKRQEFSTDLAISQDVHLCNKPSIMQVAGFLGPFIVPRGHSQGCWRCQKVSEEIEDIQWYKMMYWYKEMWEVLDVHGIVLAVLAACRHLNRKIMRPNPTGTLTQRPFYSKCLILLVQSQRWDSKQQNHEKTWSVAEM